MGKQTGSLRKHRHAKDGVLIRPSKIGRSEGTPKGLDILGALLGDFLPHSKKSLARAATERSQPRN